MLSMSFINITASLRSLFFLFQILHLNTSVYDAQLATHLSRCFIWFTQSIFFLWRLPLSGIMIAALFVRVVTTSYHQHLDRDAARADDAKRKTLEHSGKKVVGFEVVKRGQKRTKRLKKEVYEKLYFTTICFKLKEAECYEHANYANV